MMGLFSRSKKKDKKAAGGDPPEGPSSSAPDPTSSPGNNDLTAAVLTLSSADPDGCCEAANVLRAEADRGRVPASPAIKSGAVAALLSLVRGPGGGQSSSSSAGASPSGQRGVAALSAEVAALRREWREQDADRCARHAANALAAIASADPEGRPALTLVPFLLDALLTRAESRASSAAARGAAAGALFRLAGEPLAKSAIASRPDAVAGLVSLACGTAGGAAGGTAGGGTAGGARVPKPGDPSSESTAASGPTPLSGLSGGDGSDGTWAAAAEAAGALWTATVRVAGPSAPGGVGGFLGGVSAAGVHGVGFHSGVSTPGGGPSAGGSGFSTPGTVSSQALGAAAGNDAAQVVCAHLSHRHLDELAAALANGHRRRRRGRGGGGGERRDEVNGNLDADDIVTARIAATLANTCAAPACAANVARSPATLDALSLSSRSTRGLSSDPKAGESTGHKGGGDGERGEEVNPWRIRREAGLALWNLTAPNETGRAGASSNDDKTRSNHRKRVAARDGIVDGLVEMTLAGCAGSRYSSPNLPRPNGDEDPHEAIRLGAGTLGAILSEPAARSKFVKHPLADVAVRSALLRATDPGDPGADAITPTAVWLLLNAAASEEMCEFIGGDDACLGAALRVIASGGPCSVNAAAALARVARSSASCVRRLVGVDSAPGLDGKETDRPREGDANAEDAEDAEDAGKQPEEGTSGAARYLSAVIRSFLRRYADSDGRDRAHHPARSSRKPGAEAWCVAAELISAVVHGDFTAREEGRKENRGGNENDGGLRKRSGFANEANSVNQSGPWRILSGPVVDLVVALSCSGDGPTQTAIAPAAEALLAEAADPGNVVEGSERARESGMSACAALLGCCRGAASERVAKRLAAMAEKADPALTDALLSHPSLARGLARCVSDACGGQNPVNHVVVDNPGDDEHADDLDDERVTTMVPLPSPTSASAGGALSRLIPVPRRSSFGENGAGGFDSMDANASPQHSSQSARGWTGPASGALSARGGGGRDSEANARELEGWREEERARRSAAAWSITALRSLADTHASCRDRIAADLDVLEAVSAALLRGGSPLNARAAGLLGSLGAVNGGGVAAALSLGDHSSVHAESASSTSQGPGSFQGGVPRGASTVSVDALMGMMTAAAAHRTTEESVDAAVASAVEAGAALEAVAGHPRGATAIASHPTALTALLALTCPPHPARVSASAARVLRRLVAVAPPPVGSEAADTIWSVDSIAAVVSALRRRPDGSDAIQAIAQTAWFLAQLAAAAQDDESRGDIAGEEGVLESVADALALAKAPPGGCQGGATARRNAAAAASAVVSELSWTPRVRVVVISELRGGKMSVGLLDGLSAALSMESEAVHSEPDQRDPLDPCELGEHDPRASAMRAVSRLAAADPFLTRSLASSLDGFFPRVAAAAVAAAESRNDVPVPQGGPGLGAAARPGAMWFAAHAACALAVWCAPAPETTASNAQANSLEVLESRLARLLADLAPRAIRLLESPRAGSKPSASPSSTTKTPSTKASTPPVSGLRARRGGAGLTIATPDPGSSAIAEQPAADSLDDPEEVSRARLECRIALARVIGRHVALSASAIEAGDAEATSTARRAIGALVTVAGSGSKDGPVISPPRLIAACAEALRWVAGAGGETGAANDDGDRLDTLPAMVAGANGALPALVAVVERGDVAPTPGLGILGSTRRRSSAGGTGGVAGGSPPVSVRAQTDPSAAHAAIAAAAALGTLAEVARRLPRTVPARLARLKAAPSALAGFIDERAHARMCAAADRALVCTAPTVSARALLASAFRDRDGALGHHRKQSGPAGVGATDPQGSARMPKKVTYGDEEFNDADAKIRAEFNNDEPTHRGTQPRGTQPRGTVKEHSSQGGGVAWHKTSAGADGARVVAADVFAALASVAPAPVALGDPRIVLGLARMCRGGPGLGLVERIAGARALWSACLAEGDGAWHVEETEGAVGSLASLLATGGSLDDNVSDAEQPGRRVARIAAAGALGAVLSGAAASRDESRAVRCANAVCTADGVLAGVTELLRGAAKGDREGALPAAAAVALLTRVPAVAARVVSTEGTVAALVDALRAGDGDDDDRYDRSGGDRHDRSGGDDAESHALLAHAASAVGNIAAHPASAGLIAPAPGLVPGLARLLAGARPEVREMAAGAARNLALTAAGRKALRQTDGFVGKILVSLGSTSAGERHAAVGCLVNLSDDPSSLGSLAEAPGLLSALAAAADRAETVRDARLRRYVLSIFANLAADASTRRTLGMAGSSAPTVLSSLARGFVGARRWSVDPVAQVCGLESLTSLAADADADVGAIESTITDAADAIVEAVENGPAWSTPRGPSRAAVAVAASAAALVTRVASLGAGMAASELLSGDRGDRLVRSLARLADPDDADVFSSRATTGTSDKGPGSSNRGPGSSNKGPGSSNRGPSASTDSSNRDAGVESVAALASLAAMGPERAASLAAIPESFEALIRRVHAAAAVAERRTNTSGGDVVIGFAAEDAAYDLAGSHAAAALGSFAFAGVLDRDAALGVLGERAGLLRGIIACAASGNDDDDGPTGVSDRIASFLACAPRVSADDGDDTLPPGWDARACRALHALGSSSRVAARVIVSHPGDACAALARVLLVGDDESRAAAATAAAALAENVGSGGGYRATMVAAPGLVSGLRSALVGEWATRTTGRAGGANNAGGTYAAAALASLAGDGSGRGGGEAAAAVLGAAPGVVHALARALDEAEAGGDARFAATCAEGLRRLLRCEEAGASEELVRRVNALTMRE